MAWNDSGNGKDPWKKGGDEPTDLDKIVQSWQRKLRALAGGGSRSSGGASGGGGGPSGAGAYVLIVLLLIGWALTGLYRVDEAERGIVQRFGAYVATAMPGLHWHIPYPVETVDIVNTSEVADYSFSTEMLTADEAYLFIQMVVQYRRSDPVKYSFEVVDPELTLQDVTQSALREVVGTNTMEDLVAEERGEIAAKTRQILQGTLDAYGAGITVTSLNLETLDYPQAVQEAVDDTQKSRNDRDRYILEADTYAQGLIPIARGDAARILQDAEAYRDRVTAKAEGEAARFEAVLAEYQQAPRVTRERMYIDALQEVYGNANKVILDAEGSGNLLYLPIDKLAAAGRSRAVPGDVDDTFEVRIPAETTDGREDPELPRERRTRE